MENETMTFKVGDRVVDNQGDEATVRAVRNGSIAIEWDCNPGCEFPQDKERQDYYGFRIVSTSPVREVTRREIVPGTYGLLTVYFVGASLRTEFVRSDGSADELEKAAEDLIAIAKAMRNAD